MKTLLACFGGFVLFLTILGALEIGNFRLIYTSDNVDCVITPKGN